LSWSPPKGEGKYAFVNKNNPLGSNGEKDKEESDEGEISIKPKRLSSAKRKELVDLVLKSAKNAENKKKKVEAGGDEGKGERN